MENDVEILAVGFGNKLSAIANTIRQKTDTTKSLTLGEMVSGILGIPNLPSRIKWLQCDVYVSPITGFPDVQFQTQERPDFCIAMNLGGTPEETFSQFLAEVVVDYGTTDNKALVLGINEEMKQECLSGIYNVGVTSNGCKLYLRRKIYRDDKIFFVAGKLKQF